MITEQNAQVAVQLITQRQDLEQRRNAVEESIQQFEHWGKFYHPYCKASVVVGLKGDDSGYPDPVDKSASDAVTWFLDESATKGSSTRPHTAVALLSVRKNVLGSMKRRLSASRSIKSPK